MKREGRPGGDTETANKLAKADSDPILYHRQNGYAAPNAEDRAVAQAVEVLRGYGYGIAARCLDCSRPITTSSSLRRMRGPVCSARVVAK